VQYHDSLAKNYVQRDWINDSSIRLGSGDTDGFADIMDANYDSFSPPTNENAEALSALLQLLVKGLEEGTFPGQEDQPLYYTWMLIECLLKAGFALPANFDEQRLSPLAELNQELDYDGDTASLGWYHILMVFPGSDAVLDKLLVAGAKAGGYFHENAFLSPTGRTTDADRKELLVALHPLGGYTQGVTRYNADKALADLLQYHTNYRSDAPTLSVRHFRDAEGRLKALSLAWNHLRGDDWKALQEELPDHWSSAMTAPTA
jgi:hypothetical protein